MPDNRLSRLFKAKLLRRSSSPTVQSAKTVDPKSKSSVSFAAPLSPGEDCSRPRPYSTVSSLPADHLIHDLGPGLSPTADQEAPDQGTFSGRTTGLSAQERVQPGDPLDLSSTTDHAQIQDSFSTPELASSSLQTPLTTASAPGTPQDQVGSSSPPSNSKSRARPTGTPLEPQLTPSLNTVVENPSTGPAASFFPPSSSVPPSSASAKRPSLVARRQSLLPQSQQHLVSGLLDPGLLFQGDRTNSVSSTIPEMIQRKIWVKRPGGSATLVPALTDAVVDELRDQVILKYGNSLGKNFDSPDIAIRIYPREGYKQTPERVLNPEEPLVSVIDSYYPGGQKAEEALVIDIPQRRTPKPSPRQVYYHPDQAENDYFTLMPSSAGVSTPPAHQSAGPATANSHQAPAISILTTGMAPPLPSPGSRTSRRRPPLTRHATNSPPMVGQVPNAKESGIPAGGQPAQPTPPVPTPPIPPPESPKHKVNTPPARPPSPRPPHKSKKQNESPSPGAAFGGVVEGTVPPINVLIVEDNIINQKLLEAFMKRLSVRWKCAGNGEEAVRKWRQGGFHLVLMDIQLPVMNGLDATKEIRRLERLNGIGVFPKTADGRSSAANATATSPPERGPEFQLSLKEEDALEDISLFKSPVIIVALTASSLQSDRHEALAAGCNDFLTKPIGFPWLEKKVTEWGCMQALIDFEGWRKWRGFADTSQSSDTKNATTSPMQVSGNKRDTERPEPSSPSGSGSTVTPKAAGSSASNHEPHPPRPSDAIAREDSSGSVSADSLDSAHPSGSNI